MTNPLNKHFYISEICLDKLYDINFTLYQRQELAKYLDERKDQLFGDVRDRMINKLLHLLRRTDVIDDGKFNDSFLNIKELVRDDLICCCQSITFFELWNAFILDYTDNNRLLAGAILHLFSQEREENERLITRIETLTRRNRELENA